MLFRRASLIAICFFLFGLSAHACSCTNDTPIQKTHQHAGYSTFSARIVLLSGKVFKRGDDRISTMAFAVVHERYWGLPWYWPNLVLLDGRDPGGIGMVEGEEYLVSGHLERYGVVDVSSCSRTQLLSTAHIDLRTLDGSHCSAPGGTIIGMVNPPVPDAPITFQHENGTLYSTRTNSKGIYELHHLPAGKYLVHSEPNAATDLYSGGEVVSGVCREIPVRLGS